MVTGTKTAAPAESAQRRQQPTPQVSRRRRRKRAAAITRSVICALGIVFLLGYISLYAQVTLYGYRRAELTRQIRDLEMQNQGLRAEIQMLSSPERLSTAAIEAGMVPSASVVYIPRPAGVTVAKAD